jgi:hypothetical protein
VFRGVWEEGVEGGQHQPGVEVDGAVYRHDGGAPVGDRKGVEVRAGEVGGLELDGVLEGFLWGFLGRGREEGRTHCAWAMLRSARYQATRRP